MTWNKTGQDVTELDETTKEEKNWDRTGRTCNRAGGRDEK